MGICSAESEARSVQTNLLIENSLDRHGTFYPDKKGTQKSITREQAPLFLTPSSKKSKRSHGRGNLFYSNNEPLVVKNSQQFAPVVNSGLTVAISCINSLRTLASNWGTGSVIFFFFQPHSPSAYDRHLS